MAGQSIKTAITNMATRNRRKMPAMRPAKEASRCLASYCSSSSMSGQKENQCRHNEHEHDEDARDCHVIGLSSVAIRVSLMEAKRSEHLFGSGKKKAPECCRG